MLAMDIHIREFAKQNGQKTTAEIIGVTIGAISQMVNSDRQIFIRETPDGYEAYEHKSVGRKSA